MRRAYSIASLNAINAQIKYMRLWDLGKRSYRLAMT